MLDIYEYPKALHLWRDLDFHYEALLKEAKNAFVYSEATALAKVVEQRPFVQNSFYPYLPPGVEISPPRCIDKNLIQLHFGLQIPKGDCGLDITHTKEIGQSLTWQPRGQILFDATLQHSMWNRTKGQVFLLSLDLKRDCL